LPVRAHLIRPLCADLLVLALLHLKALAAVCLAAADVLRVHE
jgi:hypothetical protein